MKYSISKNNKDPFHIQIQKKIRNEILSGRLKPGDKISNEIDLSKMFHVSRATVRQALQTLQTEGLVHRTPGRGTFVRPSPRIPQFYSNPEWPCVVFIQPSTWIGRILHPFYIRMLQGLKDTLTTKQFSLYYHPMASNSEHIDLARYPNAIAVVLADIHHNKILDRFRNNNIPIISVHEKFYDDDVFCVLPDNVFGGFIATSHLIELDVLPIAHLTGNNVELMDRLKGYRRALAQNSIDYNEKYVIDARSNEDTAYTATLELLRQPEPPRAIFAGSGSMALGAFKAVIDTGLSIPQDISLLGYDDLEVFQFLHPALTTVSQRSYKIGQEVANLIFDLQSGKTNSSRDRFIKPVLIERASTIPSPVNATGIETVLP